MLEPLYSFYCSDPNDDGQGTSDNTLPVWRPFDSSTETHLSFSQNDGPVEKSGFRTKECTLWGELVPKISEYNQNCSKYCFLFSFKLSNSGTIVYKLIYYVKHTTSIRKRKQTKLIKRKQL